MAKRKSVAPEVTTEIPETNPKDRLTRAKLIQREWYDNSGDYEFDDSFQESSDDNALAVHSTPEMIKFLESHKDAEIEGSVLTINSAGELGPRKKIKNRKQFFEMKNKVDTKFKENNDWWGSTDGSGAGGNFVGQDFVPTIGGPFNKQLYLYDYLRMNSTCFYAYNHDPMAKQAINIIRDFTLGRGVRIDCEDPKALAIIRAFEKVNKLPDLLNYIAVELSLYGEIMNWELPNGQTKIQYQVMPGQEVPRGLIPRYRLIDPSCIYEIVTFPEDITRVLYYQWVSPTQYQIYSGRDAGQPVASSKFIYQQIPAGEVMHYKINNVSNEKRGRSDLFPALSYMKRLRDSVQYEVIALQKAAAWAIDTTIEGDPADLDDYVQSQQALGTVAPAGSEFVHTKSVKREYLSNSSAGTKSPEAFSWCLSMIASAVGIPVQYFGTHISNSGTRASALISTEPVAKKFEQRQQVYENIIRDMVRRTLTRFGIEETVEFEVTFPEIVTSDRSAKLRDISMSEAAGWINKERAANMAAQELGVAKYDFDKEFANETEPAGPTMTPILVNPLTAKPTVSKQTDDTQRGLSSNDKKDIKDEQRTL